MINRDKTTNQRKLVVQGIYKLYVFLLVICIPAEPLFSFYVRWLLLFIGLFIVIVIEKSIFITSYLKFQICFTIMLVISLLYSPEGAKGMNIIMSNTRALLQSYIIVLLTLLIKDTTENRIRIVLNSYTFGTVMIILYTLFVEREYIFGSGGYWRMGKIVFENHDTFMVLSYSIIISILWSGFNLLEKKEHKKINLILTMFLLLSAVLSGTKKTLITVIMGVMVYLVIKNRNRAWKLLIGLIIGCILIILGYRLIIHNDFLYSYIGHRIQNYLFSIRGLEEGTESTTTRALMRSYGLKLFFKSPIIGNGVSSFRWYFFNYTGKFLYSHCNYIELLCNHGFIGFVFYYAYCLWLTHKSFKLYYLKSKSIYLFFTIFLLILLILDYGQVSYYRVHYMLVAQVAALAVVKGKKYSISIDEERKFS